MGLKGKNVLITGSSRGIGKAIALAFAKEGCNIILNASTSSDELLKTQEELKEMGFYSYACLTDVSDYKRCAEMFNTIYSIYGNVDILINNAGINFHKHFRDMQEDEWNKMIDVNFKSVLNCTHLALPKMISSKSGNIINISSVWGERGASCEAVFAATKGAVNSFTKSMAKELGPSGIRVNAISCGVIDTEKNLSFTDDEREILSDEISLMRFGTPDEIAKIALFLAKEDSSFITGQIITADGCML
ncbi:MAG: SDR family oxidoreductase [Firmicutes bacterium]|nr:SDR family oxidoreductase [Bacillota bacterium]